MLRGMKRLFSKAMVTGLRSMLTPQARAASTREVKRSARAAYQEGAWVLEFDIPAWGFSKGEQVRIFPNVPIYLDDIVALRSEEGLKLARYRDEYMGSVAGLAVRV